MSGSIRYSYGGCERFDHDAKTTRVFQQVFGEDVVKAVYVESDERRVTDADHCDGVNLVLEFHNGRKVLFHNSEWAGFRRIPDWAE